MPIVFNVPVRCVVVDQDGARGEGDPDDVHGAGNVAGRVLVKRVRRVRGRPEALPYFVAARGG